MLQKYCYAVTKKQTALSLGKKSFRGVKNSSVYAELFFWRGMKGNNHGFNHGRILSL